MVIITSCLDLVVFTTIKSQDAYLRFVFLTGVSKFSQVSIFSGLNNLDDISLNGQYAELLGCYTEKEILCSFSDRLALIASQNNQKIETIIDEMRNWYNGYRFSRTTASVYNPFSVLKYLQEGILRNSN